MKIINYVCLTSLGKTNGIKVFHRVCDTPIVARFMRLRRYSSYDVKFALCQIYVSGNDFRRKFQFSIYIALIQLICIIIEYGTTLYMIHCLIL